MHWDINELESKLNTLNNLYNNETDKYNKESLLKDIYTIKSMINMLLGYTKYSISSIDFDSIIIDLKRVNNSFNYVIKNSNIFRDFSFLISQYSIKDRLIFTRGIKVDEYYSLLDSFFKQLSSEYYKDFTKSVNSNSIELGNANSTGITVFTTFDKTAYAYTKYDRKGNNLGTLAHEVGHIHQYNYVSNATECYNLIYSLFREAFPIFIKFAFLDYLKTTKHKKLAYEKEIEHLSNMGSNIEFNQYFINNLHNSKYSNERLYFADGSISSEFLMGYYGDFIALYLLDMYRSNKVKGLDFIESFNSRVGRVADEELFDEFRFEDLEKSYRKEVSLIHGI